MRPTLQTYAKPVNFLRRAESFLEAHETENNLILGVVIRLVEQPGWTEEPPYLAVMVGAQGRISLAAVMTPPNRLLLASSTEVPAEEQDVAVEAVIDNLRAGNWPVPGVTAENTLAQRFARRWSQATGQQYHVRMRMRVYELRQVIRPSSPPPGFLRAATVDDLETVANWVYNFHAEATPEADRESARKMALRRIETQDIFLWDDQGPVSMALRSRPTAHGYTVSGVYTPPELRGRGYASACVAELSQRLLDSGKQFCNLFTDLSNPTSNSIYQKIGYYPLCDFMEYGFTTD